MRIAFDAKRLFFNDTGLGNYARSLVRNIGKEDSAHELTLMTPKMSDTKYKEFMSDRYEIVFPGQPFLWRSWRMVNELKQRDFHIYHGLSNELPWGIQSVKNLKSIVTIHDLIFLKYPEYYPLIDRTIYFQKFKRACNDADHIIAVSESTKADIIEFFKTDKDKITVIYQACDEIYYESDLTINEPQNYGLFVGSITPRKNLNVVIDALTLLKNEDRPVIKVVGKGGIHQKKLIEKINSLDLSDHFVFLENIDKYQLKELYKNAKFSIYPSFYEGFGIPVLESLLCGTPAITSNISSMPEAGFGLAELVNPHSAEDVAQKLYEFHDSVKRISKEKIRKLSSTINPELHAKKTLELYQDVLQDK